MIKKRLGSLAVRRVLPAAALLAVCLSYASMRDAPALMAAVATRELPVYNRGKGALHQL